MPARLLGMYARAIPQLKAEQRLDRINEMMAVWGEDSPDRQGFLRGLELTANGGQQRATKPTVNQDGVIPVGGSFNIPVETIE